MKVLIVEDEYYARKRLVKLLNECEEDMELAAALWDGAAAVEYLEQHTDVDVVVTDIVMPRMGGLQLAEYVYHSMPYVQVVIVSGYEEFDYARKAIEYEVKQYLIKPVRKEEFLRTLSELGEKKENYRREVEDVVQERLAMLPYGFPLSAQILGNRKLMSRYLPDYIAAGAEVPCRIAVIQLERAFSREEAALAHRICMQRLEGSFCGGFYCKGEDEYVFCLLEERIEHAGGSLAALEELLHYFRVKLDAGIAIGLSRPFTGCENAADAYKECLYAINNRLIKGWNQVYEYHRGRTGRYSFHELFDMQDESMLMGALQVSDYGRAAGLVHELLHKQELLAGGDVNALYDVTLNILRTVSKYYRSLYQASESRVEIMFSRRYDLYSFKHPEELEDYLLGILREICNYKQSSPNGGNAIIRDILHYVERNYEYDLSLQELAEKKYFMNPSYLSRLFKSEVGKTFSGYVIELRIEKARELLEDRTLKINDIAAQVGYHDTSHFIRSFKKICGCTPEELRNRSHGECGNRE